MTPITAGLEEVFSAALALQDPHKRCVFLDAACSDNPQLRAQVEGLLQAHERSGTFLQFSPATRDSRTDARSDTRNVDVPMSRLGSTRFSLPDPDPLMLDISTAGHVERPGDRIGRYKLIEPIGEGGFGSVFKAEQEFPVRRQVAVKILKLGMDTRRVVSRFETERQTLALMDHPNIARVLDAGATEALRPYIVMELVADAVPINKYCDAASLPIRERLELFVSVCLAVQHAHQKGIIHRDLKPSNVLITFQDGKPVPKVIDFGIAKAVRSRSADATQATEQGQFIGTPDYMSPEQAEMSAHEVDTRSDIYALGVLLYELLAGVTPFERDALLNASYAEIQRVIREVEPSRPSVRLSGMGESLAHAAKNRRTDPQRLVRLVRGELDWIVMRCMEKDRTRRYDSASALADDLRRHLADEPVLARPPGRIYSLRKFVRRHKVMVGAAAAVAAALLLGVIGTGVGMIRARNERDNTIRAKEEIAAANKVLMDMRYAFATNFGGIGSPRKRLDQLAARLDAGWLNDQPEIRISVLSALGGIYRGASWYEHAERHFTTARDLSERVYGPNHPDVAYQLVLLGWALVDSRKDYERAEAHFQRALEISRAQPDGNADLLTADCLRYLAAVRDRRGDPERARALRWDANKVAVAWRTRELANTPDDRELLFGRALLRMRLGEMTGAQADLDRCVELDLTDHWARFYRGVLRLYHGNEAGYVDDRRHFLRQAQSQQARSTEMAESLAVIAVLRPFPDQGSEDATAIRRALDTALSPGEQSPGPWLQLYKGAAEFRQGRLQSAIDTLENVRGSRTASIAASAESLIAMACHGLGQSGAANEAWRRAAGRVDRGLPVGGVNDLGSDPEQWLICQILIREAQATIPYARDNPPAKRPTTRPIPATGPIATVP